MKHAIADQISLKSRCSNTASVFCLAMFISFATMKVLGTVLFLLHKIQLSTSYSPYALDYVLQAIEYISEDHVGVFSIVFYDIGLNNRYENIWSDVLRSPRLNHVVKYVIQGSYNDRFEELPWHPTLLIVHPGQNLHNLLNIKWDITQVLKLFNPTTKVLAFVNFANANVAQAMTEFIFHCKFTSSIFLDIATMQFRQCNGKWCWNLDYVPNLDSLFTYGRRSMEGQNITFFLSEHQSLGSWNIFWIKEVARYLNTVAVQYRHDCTGSGQKFRKCMEEYRTSLDAADIVFSTMRMTGDIPRDFRQLFTSNPLMVQILVPRDRPYNTFELMLMPFTSNVWALLVLIMVSAEVGKRLFPLLLKNDPILFVVCGFERHNLHNSGRWEKTILISLIILMFFMSHAFETKIISLIISKPSIQRVKTLEDLYDSDIKIYADLENSPHYRDHPVIGKLVVQGKSPGIGENIPGIALAMLGKWTEAFIELSFDYEQSQPFYVALEYQDFAGCELYRMTERSLFVEVFRHFHITLVEAGIMDAWNRQFSELARFAYVGKRPRLDIRNKVYLDLGDMKVAWLVLASGAFLGVVCLLGELVKRRFDSRWMVGGRLRWGSLMELFGLKK